MTDFAEMSTRKYTCTCYTPTSNYERDYVSIFLPIVFKTLQNFCHIYYETVFQCSFNLHLSFHYEGEHIFMFYESLYFLFWELSFMPVVYFPFGFFTF